VSSIVNGLFAGRAGIGSHGAAIAVVGDNISNASTIGFKASRAEFEDLMAGDSAGSVAVGSGSSLAAVSTVFEQGTFEFTGRALDLAIDGNGFFVVAKDAQRFYTRAGNFKVDSSGYVVNQGGLAVLGFPSNGSGALEPLNINAIEQSSVATTTVSIAGNVNASSPVMTGPIPDTAANPPVTTYADLNNAAAYSTVVDIFDSLGQTHTVTFFFFHTAPNEYTARAYVSNEEIDANPTVSGFPRLIDVTTPANSQKVMTFRGDGQRTAPATPDTPDIQGSIAWNNGANPTNLSVNFSPFTQYSANANILSISQDGKGIGAVTDVNIGENGQISAVLSNGQTALIGTVGLVNFASPEGLTRIGKNLLSQSPSSGEPIVGRPTSGTFGALKSGSVELSTVDIASEFVKIITLQRGFQASSRIITTINQLLNDIIQLA
jgi:flagellar hook protein FlgE